MTVRTLLHDGGHARYELVHIVLAQVVRACAFLALLIRNVVGRTANNELHSAIYLLSNLLGLFQLYVL